MSFTPHGLRAGGATDMKLRGELIPAIQEMGRWEFPKTCKRYVDVVQTRLEVALQAEQRVPQVGVGDFSDMIGPVF